MLYAISAMPRVCPGLQAVLQGFAIQSHLQEFLSAHHELYCWEGAGEILVCLPVPASRVSARGSSSTEQGASVYCGDRRLEQRWIPVRISINLLG